MGTVTQIRSNEPDTVEEWQNFISESRGNEVGSVIETGKRLILAKDKTDHGKWLKIFEGKNRPCSEDMAQYRMAIARHSVLANTVYIRYLPQAVSTLYELSQISEQDLLELIRDGKVYPELKRSEAKALKDYPEKIKTLLLIIVTGAKVAVSNSPCDCRELEGKMTQEVVDEVQKAADTWTRAADYMRSLMRKEE